MSDRNNKSIFILKAKRALNHLGLRKKKIFAIGFNKSGTTSLHALFESLGRPSYHGVDWRACDNLDLLRSYDCFSDDIPQDLPKLDRMFPSSKFILQVRELDTWIYSRLAHIDRYRGVEGYKQTPTWDTTEHAVKTWIEQRNRHHLHVLSYFQDRPSDLLVVNFIRDPSAATRISRFLGYDRKFDRPRENVKPDRAYPAEHVALLRKCVTDLGLSDEELTYDLLCPSLIEAEARDRFPADTSLLGRMASAA
jgi:hypothetical protein